MYFQSKESRDIARVALNSQLKRMIAKTRRAERMIHHFKSGGVGLLKKVPFSGKPSCVFFLGLLLVLACDHQRVSSLRFLGPALFTLLNQGGAKLLQDQLTILHTLSVGLETIIDLSSCENAYGLRVAERVLMQVYSLSKCLWSDADRLWRHSP